MELLKLSSDNKNFKTIKFKPGLNIIAGLQLTEEQKKSINGIGKSFSLQLVHWILGAGLKPGKTKKFLSNYGEFTLEFNHRGKKYKIRKNFAHTKFSINGKSFNAKKYPSELTSILVGDSIGLSFRQLLNAFARRHGSHYNDALTQQGTAEFNFHQRLTNLALLGLNVELVNKKKETNEKHDKALTAKKDIQSRRAVEEEYSPVENLKDSQLELRGLKKSWIEFEVAENFNELKKNADLLTERLNLERDRIFEVQKAVQLKKRSLEESKSVNIETEQVRRLYEEAKFYFEESIFTRLKEADQFHRELKSMRIKRLVAEISQLQLKEGEVHAVIVSLGDQRDSFLKLLSSKGALEEYNSLALRINELENKIVKAQSYDNLVEDYAHRLQVLKQRKEEIAHSADDYLRNTKDLQSIIEDKFRALVMRFYENKGGSLKFTRADDAKYLFNINVDVPGDGSQGVNEVKIFCYDFLLFELNPELLQFIAHAGCIFSEMDPRQKSTIFKLAIEYTQKSSMQYFINVGQSTLNEVLDSKILDPVEKAEIRNSIILELYDIDPSSFLMGVAFD